MPSTMSSDETRSRETGVSLLAKQDVTTSDVGFVYWRMQLAPRNVRTEQSEVPEQVSIGPSGIALLHLPIALHATENRAQH